MGIIVSLAILAFIVAFHEFGHFIVAKLCKVKVDVFSIGFGHPLMSKKIGDTEYCLSPIPLGGYVKMDEASYESRPIWNRLLILFAGPAFNFILGAVLVISGMLIYGIPFYSSAVGKVAENSPAARADIRSGDVIEEIDGRKVKEWNDVAGILASKSLDKEINITIRRGNNNIIAKVTPEIIDGRPKIGIMAPNPILVKDPLRSFGRGITDSSLMLKSMISGIYSLVTGKLPLSRNLGGPIAITQMGSQISHEVGLEGLFMFTALISFNLGLLNLLPIPVLDGGGIIILFVELVIRRPLNRKLKMAIQGIGLAFILALMFFVIFNDIRNLFSK